MSIYVLSIFNNIIQGTFFSATKSGVFFLPWRNSLSLAGSFSSLHLPPFGGFFNFSLHSDKIPCVLQLIPVWAHGSLCESPWIHP